MSKNYCHLLSAILLIVISNFSWSSSISPALGNAPLVIGQDADLLTIGTPQNLVSNLVFSSFAINKPLKLINVKDPNRSPFGAAKLIIIQANNISITSADIEVVGETADVLFVSSNPGAVMTCSYCKFKNIGRLTFATTTAPIGVDGVPAAMALVGGTINLNNFSTEGVAASEFIANYVYVDGSINTQTRASYASDGNYILNPSGNLIVGAGGVNIFSGFNVDYKSLRRTVPASNSSLSLPASATISSQAVLIEAAKPFNQYATISTKSDIAAEANYRSQISAVEESIKMYCLNAGIPCNVIVGGSLLSDNLVDIRSSANLTFNGTIQAGGLIAVAGGKLTHNYSGSMSLPGSSARWPLNDTPSPNFVSAYLTADTIENNGTIKGGSLVLASINNLQNRFGGKLFADNIQLSSRAGFIRNGSDYPFKSASDTPLIFSPNDPTNIPLGTVTIDGQPFKDAMNGATKQDLTALILGKSIVIVAAGNVENINPYFETTTNPSTWAGGVTFVPYRASQVQILAENKLNIGSQTYVLNSSAIMGVSNPGAINDPEHEFVISSPRIANQRYTTQAVVQSYKNSAGTYTTSGTEAVLEVYSPPGNIYSFAPLSFLFGNNSGAIASGGFINNTSYFEVLNDANFSNVNSFNLVNIGLALQKVVTSSVNNSWTSCIRAGFNAISGYVSPSYIEGIYRTCDYQYPPQGTLGTAEAMQGTLFSVKGKTYGENGDLTVRNHYLYDDLKNQLIGNYIAQNTGQTGSGSTVVPISGGGTVNYTYQRVTTISSDQTTFYTSDVITSRTHNCSSSNCTGAFSVGSSTNSSSQSVSAYLSAKFAELKAALEAAITAFQNWWNTH